MADDLKHEEDEAVRRKRMEEFAFEQLNQARARLNEKRDTENQYQEGLFLKNQCFASMAQRCPMRSANAQQRNAWARQTLDTIIQRHECVPRRCSFENMRVGQTFSSSNGSTYTATGEVCICKESSLIHMCGTHCREHEVRFDHEGVVCRLTGRLLAVEMAMTDGSSGRDIRVVGDVVYDHAAQSAEQEHVDLRKNTVYERLLAISHSELDASHAMRVVSDRYPNRHTTPEMIDEMLAECKQRARLRKVAAEQYNRVVMNEDYERDQEKRIQDAQDKFTEQLKNYYEISYRAGRAVDYVNIYILWLKFAAPAYTGVYIGGQSKQIRDMLRERTCEAMLLFWDKLSELELAKNDAHTFSACSLSILKLLSEGMTTKIYVDPSTGKPTRSSSAPPTSDGNTKPMEAVQFVFAPKHPLLVIPPIAAIRKRNPPMRRHINSRITAVTSAVNKRRGLGTSCRPKTARITRAVVQPMTSKAACHQLLMEAIEKAPTLDALREYCIETIMPTWLDFSRDYY